MSAPFDLVQVSPGDGNPLDRFPQLATLWSPVLASIAHEAIDEAFEQHFNAQVDYGAIFLVTHPENTKDIWGITGFLPWPDDATGILQRAALRWHGLLPEHRGQGLSLAIIDRMRHLAQNHYPEASQFIEFMPVSQEHAATAKYFEAAGFTKCGAPERVYWSTDLWQEYACDIRVPLQALHSEQTPAP